MLSIEATFEALHLNADVAAKPLARTLALAGFELGIGLTACNSSACSTQPPGSTDWQCKYCEGRARIEALGKEG